MPLGIGATQHAFSRSPVSDLVLRLAGAPGGMSGPLLDMVRYYAVTRNNAPVLAYCEEV